MIEFANLPADERELYFQQAANQEPGFSAELDDLLPDKWLEKNPRAPLDNRLHPTHAKHIKIQQVKTTCVNTHKRSLVTAECRK